jgi:hemerythrin-like domain-containing protein
MLRDKSLIPLSHQHQRALALCVRIERASPIPEADSADWQVEISRLFEREIKIHFTAEEEVLFPAARKFPELVPLVSDLCAQHAVLRKDYAKAERGAIFAADLPAFARRLSGHIRKEERELFERMQQLMTPQELAGLGERLQEALKEATQSCALPNPATKLRREKCDGPALL